MLSRISRSIQPKLIKKRKKNNGSDSDSGGTLAEEGRKEGRRGEERCGTDWVIELCACRSRHCMDVFD